MSFSKFVISIFSSTNVQDNIRIGEAYKKHSLKMKPIKPCDGVYPFPTIFATHVCVLEKDEWESTPSWAEEVSIFMWVVG